MSAACGLLATRSATTRAVQRKHVVRVSNFITVDKSIRKVKTMLDFGKSKRLEVIHKLYGNLTEQSFQEALADDFVMVEAGRNGRYNKQEYINTMTKLILPAVPDFTWGHLTNGDVDDDGYCIVTVKASGHHTGTAFAIRGCPPIEPSGRHFSLAQETHKVRVSGNQVHTIIALPSMDPGPKALYDALKDY